MTPSPTPVAVVGVGHMGRHHARIYAELDATDLVAVVDADAARAEECAARHGARPLSTVDDLPDHGAAG